MKQYLKKLSAAGLGITFAVGSMAAVSVPTFALSNASDEISRYRASLHPLNHSGVSGNAKLLLDSQQPGASLDASVQARGTEPNQIHAIHIHGKLDAENAECPTIKADTNMDRIVSVFEGAPFYGPIKVNFTDPVTPFGPPANTTLFAPFAGSPTLENFPRSDGSGKVSYNKTIPFDQNNQFAVQALDSIMPLNDQHIVIHGGFAPESVDTAGGDPNKTVYDPLLPVACGQIVQTQSDSNGRNNGNGGSNGGHNGGSTGPGSNNQTSQTTTNSTKITNTNNVDVDSRTTQSSTSGDATVNRNTNGGSAESGNATNSSLNSFFIRLMNSGFFRN